MADKSNPSISISNPHPGGDAWEKTGLGIFTIGVLFVLVAAFGAGHSSPLTLFLLSFLLITGGSLLYIIRKYMKQPAGVRNDHNMFRSLTSRGMTGWMLGIGMTGFYILIYWHNDLHLLNGVIAMMDPVSQLISGAPASQWFLYGFLYTLSMLILGLKAILKYRHSNYQVIRTFSVMFVQLGFGFLIPYLLKKFNQPEFYFSYFWPLEYKYLFPDTVSSLTQNAGALGTFMVGWGMFMTFVATPVLTYFFGKRWYCSWVCGCGGLANTTGDPFRHLSDKSLKAWQIERWSIHSVLVIIVVGTLMLWINSWTGGGFMAGIGTQFTQWYGFFIGMVFSGVIGVGFYPVLGTRVWCRFGCPMAAILGILQKYFSRFRITANGDQCISCGNCSAYCEMGIDVKWYAQRGQNIVRASCVGCGMCSTVCPRGVLNLENGPTDSKYMGPVSQERNEVKLMD